MNDKYSKAYTEVIEILKHIPVCEYNKIPKDIISQFNRYKDNNYVFTFDESKPIEQQNISREANAIIISVFNDYFATKEQYNEINKKLYFNSISNDN